VTLAAPTLVSTLAIFHRTFRRLSTWSILVFTYAIGAALDLASNSDIHDYWGLLSVVWCVWCVVLGVRIRRLDDDAGHPEQRPLYAGLKLALLGCVSLILFMIAEDAISARFYDLHQTSWLWLIRLSFLSAGFAVTLVFGLRWYRGFNLGRALIGGTIVLACGCIGAFVLGEALLLRQFTADQIGVWGLSVLGPCAAAGLAVIDRSFRQIWLYALLGILYAGTVAASAWLVSGGYIDPVGAVLLFFVASIVWLVPIGYRMTWARLRAGIIANSPGLGARQVVQA
jgi:hypothetical protein